MTNEDLDFDSILDLEDRFYAASYNDAFREGQAHTLRDGKQFGIQTGFQRFILIGALRKLNEILLEITAGSHAGNTVGEITPNQTRGGGGTVNFEKHHKSLAGIQKSIDLFFSNGASDIIEVSNTPADVELYEKTIKLIRSKMKIVYSQMGYKSLYPELENRCRDIAGDIPTTQINGDEQDMW